MSSAATGCPPCAKKPEWTRPKKPAAECTFIRTAQDWQDYKAGARFSGHPLNGLTFQQLADFEASLWIVDGGVVSMNIGILRDNLSPTAHRGVLRAFGITPILAEEHKDYECVKRATCKLKYFHICLSTC